MHFAAAFPGETSLYQEFQVVPSSLFGNKFIGKLQWVLYVEYGFRKNFKLVFLSYYPLTPFPF